jgi:hypothetical protein
MNKFLKVIYLSAFFLMNHVGLVAQESISEHDVKRLYKQMQGFYSSYEQSAEDSSYFDIHLKMVPMWQDYEGYWLYVEQAMAGSEDKPYRQRVYQLVQRDDSTIESRVYTIRDGEQYYGQWKSYNPLHQVTLDQLEERKGCSIFLRKVNRNFYEGSTHHRDCESSLKGASFATSEVSIMPGELHSWDRGFDASGKQVWGAVKGAYKFKKYRYTY